MPTPVGTLQLSKLMMEKAHYRDIRRLFPKIRLLFTDTNSVMVQICDLRPAPRMAKATQTAPQGIEVMASKLGDKTFPARILEYVQE